MDRPVEAALDFTFGTFAAALRGFLEGAAIAPDFFSKLGEVAARVELTDFSSLFLELDLSGGQPLFPDLLITVPDARLLRNMYLRNPALADTRFSQSFAAYIDRLEAEHLAVESAKLATDEHPGSRLPQQVLLEVDAIDMKRGNLNPSFYLFLDPRNSLNSYLDILTVPLGLAPGTVEVIKEFFSDCPYLRAHFIGSMSARQSAGCENGAKVRIQAELDLRFLSEFAAKFPAFDEERISTFLTSEVTGYRAVHVQLDFEPGGICQTYSCEAFMERPASMGAIFKPRAPALNDLIQSIDRDVLGGELRWNESLGILEVSGFALQSIKIKRNLSGEWGYKAYISAVKDYGSKESLMAPQSVPHSLARH